MSDDGGGTEAPARRNYTVRRCGAPAVQLVNQQLAEIDAGQPQVFEIVGVFNATLEEFYLILIHRVNHSVVMASQAQRLVKLSERRFAPSCARELRLATPAHYRKSESANDDTADPHDGLLTIDATPWMRQVVAPNADAIHSLSAIITVGSPEEPWVYCTSKWPASRSESEALRARFPKYDAMTAIEDAETFAIQLGIDFAIAVQKSMHAVLRPFEELGYRLSSYRVGRREGEHPIDKVVRVYHGPVVYEDQSGVMGSVEDVVDSSMVPRTWFTKKTVFSVEREYRFAVSTLGRPRTEVFMLGISDELRMLTTKV